MLLPAPKSVENRWEEEVALLRVQVDQADQICLQLAAVRRASRLGLAQLRRLSVLEQLWLHFLEDVLDDAD